MGLAKLALIICIGAGHLGGQQEGYAARYAPGVMARVARVRHIAPADCMVALTSARTITGRQWVWILGRRTRVLRRCKVIDLPQERDRKGLEAREIVVELDHESAREICGSVVDPPRQCPVIIWR